MATYDKAAMQRKCHEAARKIWAKAASIEWINGRKNALGIMPPIEMNARLTTTGGRAWINEPEKTPHEYEKIDLSCYIMANNPWADFERIILVHEICHFIAGRVYGDYGHGKGFKYVTYMMGGEQGRFHNLNVLKREKPAFGVSHLGTRKRITSEV